MTVQNLKPKLKPEQPCPIRANSTLQVLRLLSQAYSMVAPARVAACLGLPEEPAVQLVQARGWQLQDGWLVVRPAALATAQGKARDHPASIIWVQDKSDAAASPAATQSPHRAHVVKAGENAPVGAAAGQQAAGGGIRGADKPGAHAAAGRADSAPAGLIVSRHVFGGSRGSTLHGHMRATWPPCVPPANPAGQPHVATQKYRRIFRSISN